MPCSCSGTRDQVKLLCAPLFTTGAHGKAIFKVLYYSQDIDIILMKLFLPAFLMT